MGRSGLIRIAALVTLISAVVFLAYGPTRNESTPLLIGYGVAFIGYLIVLHRVRLLWSQLIMLALGLRLVLLFAPITWSDDHYRYLWDGLCTTHGSSPYAHVPSELADPGSTVFTADHFELLNSPEFHSVYPPVAQVAFAIAAWIGGGDLSNATIALRVLVIGFDLLAILALASLLKGRSDRTGLVGLYALNPLVLLEFSVNLHTEVFMIAPCLFAIHLFDRQRYDASAAVLALAAAAKLWPLLFLAWIPSHIGWKSGLRFIAITTGLFLVSWIPFHTPDMVSNIVSSLKLYFSYLEFNGGLFEGSRHVLGDGMVKGTGLLSGITLLALGLYVFRLLLKKRISWAEAMLWILAIYLFGSQAVHPWSVLPLVAFAALTRFRWPILWTLLIVPTYLTYRTEPFEQPYWWIATEYTALFAFIVWELYSRTDREPSSDPVVT